MGTLTVISYLRDCNQPPSVAVSQDQLQSAAISHLWDGHVDGILFAHHSDSVSLRPATR